MLKMLGENRNRREKTELQTATGRGSSRSAQVFVTGHGGLGSPARRKGREALGRAALGRADHNDGALGRDALGWEGRLRW